mmetsp:Transcript_16912/g.2779  ORF Transcript_16912/g.2779 Transcript_16912/m.2779 type:complete len:82 (+) Transcript_16912:11374-11619(+)
MELFTFLGKMMGVAIRTQNNMNLTLPPLFWKRLVIEDVDIEDLKGVDECADQIFRFMLDMDSKDISVENFESVFGRLMFTA